MYEFDVFCEEDGTRKTIKAKGNDSLYKFAEKIVKEFDFELDHCFGFYSDFEKLSNSSKAYELFVDAEAETSCTGSKSVKKTKISQAFQQVGEMMLFLFDYGDNNRFAVKLMRIPTKWVKTG
ncbi:MAG: hypothetical protein NTZ10_03300 [Candidatus Saganbacteria bacterium]|nr:hypothetical protein [Candidatus Saganbacteria bacterium]